MPALRSVSMVAVDCSSFSRFSFAARILIHRFPFLLRSARTSILVMAARRSAEKSQPFSPRNVLRKAIWYSIVQVLYAPYSASKLSSEKILLRGRRWKRNATMTRMGPKRLARTWHGLRGVRRISKINWVLWEVWRNKMEVGATICLAGRRTRRQV